MAPTNNMKLPGRQTNNSLSSLSGNVFIPPAIFGNSTAGTSSSSIPNSGNNKNEISEGNIINNNKNKEKLSNSGESPQQKRKKTKTSEITNQRNLPPNIPFISFTETDEILQIGMHKVLVYVKNHKDAWPFMDPVEEDIAPRYYSIIRRPMDLLKMEEKLDNGEYTKFSDFRNDFKLIVNNCRLYNGQENEYTLMVNNLQKAFEKATKTYFDQNSSDEEPALGYPDSRTNVFREKNCNKSTTAKTNKDKESAGENKFKEKEKCEKLVLSSSNKEEKSIEKNSSKDKDNLKAIKRKRKDKDKRRKKKMKLKSSSKLYDDNESSDDNDDESINNFRNNNIDSEKHSKRKGQENYDFNEDEKISLNNKSKEKKESTIVSSNKISKGKTLNKSNKIEKNQKSCQQSKIKSKKIQEEKFDNNFKKQDNNKSKTKSGKKESKKKHFEEDNFSNDEIDYNAKNKETNKNNTCFDEDKLSNEIKTHSKSIKKIEKHSSTNSTNNLKLKEKEKEKEKENQNTKTTLNRNNKKNIHSKEDKSSFGTNKKKKNKSKKNEKNTTENTTSAVVKKDSQNSEYDSVSRSPSPLFKVDLHKKYANSASMHFEDELLPSTSKNSFENNTNSKALLMEKPSTSKKTNNFDDLTSLSNKSLSRNSSPNLNESSDELTEEENKTKPSTSKGYSKLKKSKDKPPKTAEVPQNSDKEDNNEAKPFYDKYDLIKQRRSRNAGAEDKWTQIVKDNEKLKDPKRSKSNEKNQTLKETIKKLKVTTAISHKSSVLFEEILGVKPSVEIQDTSKIIEKLREVSSVEDRVVLEKKINKMKSDEMKSLKTEYQNKKKELKNMNDSKENVPKKKEKDKEKDKDKEKEKLVINKRKNRNDEKSSEAKKSLQKRCPSASSSTKKNSSNTKTNMEALALETEQTLKDINRWLEHTPCFPEFNSESNSPSTYNLEDFNSITPKHDQSKDLNTTSTSENSEMNTNNETNKNDVLVTATNIGGEDSNLQCSNNFSASSSSSTMNTPSQTLNSNSKPKESNTSSSMQLLSHPPPPPPHVKTQQQKEAKRKSLKEKIQAVSKRKDPLRTIDRLQPGKTKGNLINNVHANNKDEIFPLGGTNKIKEVKNSLVVKTDESAPKLSLGSVLNTDGFGLGQLHNFGNDLNSRSSDSEKLNSSFEISLEDINEKSNDIELNKETLSEEKIQTKSEKVSATPNLSAWFKAFGAPKKAKKLDEEEKKIDSLEGENHINSEKSSENLIVNNTVKSPSISMENFSLPTLRTRKASTGSTISERSSFSQDPDSPRVGIDDRFGSYPGPYASPIGASPIMVSPKQDEIVKPTSPYSLNGAIKVGFYQDTTTKSSPEKSCSPRELPSPYPQYSQHVYTTVSSPTIANDNSNSYGNCYNGSNDLNKTTSSTMYPSASSVTLYEQYKQPQSQESDYNSSVSPSTNPNSPYQQSQNSPYQQHPNSPYQSQNSPYHQPQNSPYQGQSSNAPPMVSMVKSPSSHQQSLNQQHGESPQGPHSPYQQSISSPYQNSNNSPYNQQNPSSPYHTQSQAQQSQPQVAPQMQQQMNFSQQVESPQQQPSDSPFSQDSPQYQIHDSPQFQQIDQPQNQTFDSDITENSNKVQNSSEWNSSQIDVSNSNSQIVSGRTLTELSPMVPPSHQTNQINNPHLHSDQHNSLTQLQIHHQQQPDNKSNLQFQGYTQYPIGNKDNIMQQDQNQTNTIKGPQSNDQEVIGVNYNESQVQNKTQECGPEKSFNSTLNKHQQMFDTFLGSMGGNKNLGFGRPPIDVSANKAFEVFNRAATIEFTKEFPNNLITNKMNAASLNSSMANNMQGQQMPPQHLEKNSLNNNFNQEQLMHHQQSQSLENTQKIHQQQGNLYGPKQITNQGHSYSNPNLIQQTSMGEKMANDVVNSNLHQDQINKNNRNQTMNLDLNNYKQTYNSGPIIDPLRNINHSLPVMDENILSLQNVSASAYYDKHIPPAHMFNKNFGPQGYQNPYETRSNQNSNITGNSYIAPPAINNNVQQSSDVVETTKPAKRTRKKKNATANSSVETLNNQNRNSSMASNQTNIPPPHQSSVQSQVHSNSSNHQSIHDQQQGFQLYAGLKTAATSGNSTDSPAISLKPATSMVPGSAFNFGPTQSGLGLPSGIYSDNSGYLDEYRNPHNPYYPIPQSHRGTSEVSNEKSNVPPPAAPPPPGPSPSTYQFLTHSSSRAPAYPFMNTPQLDPNSPIYQHIQRQEELRARMMLNQGLLPPSTAPGYPQTSYRPPIGMPKPYDMNRQPWF